MTLVVQKYGGSSLASAKFIKKVAVHIGQLRDDGNDVVVVVSAMGKTTDELTKLAHEVSSDPDKREMDMLLSVGERVSISLLAMALHDLGHDAISFTGSQVGIITDNEHTRARILEIRADRLLDELKKKKIVIVAGFQGVSLNKEITTLGRGGSDTTAVALGAALKADRVELMKDVDGILKADPQMVESPEVIRQITYKEMQEMASLDAGVLKTESIALAEYYGVKVGVGSSFTGKVGTIITDRSFMQDSVKSISCDTEILFVTIKTKEAAKVSQELMHSRLVLYNYVQEKDKIRFYTARKWENDIKEILFRFPDSSGEYNDQYAMISFVGEGIKPGSETAAKIFTLLASSLKESYEVIATESRISVFVDKRSAKNLVNQFYKELKLNGTT